eukprot:jgi/Mesen1/4068/ME000213S03094
MSPSSSGAAAQVSKLGPLSTGSKAAIVVAGGATRYRIEV